MPKPNPMDIIGMATNPIGSIVGSIVGQVLARHDVPLDNKDVPATVAKIEKAMKEAVEDDKIAVVPVKSGMFSKINWVQFAAPVATILAGFGLPLTADQIIAVFVVGQLGQSAVTFVIRQWFTKSVTASAMKGT